MLSRKILFLLLLLSSSSALQAQTADAIVSKHIAFIGGTKNWHKIHSIVSSGTYNYGGVTFPFEAWSKAPNSYKYVVRSRGKYFAQAYDGKQGWRIDKFNGETSKTMLNGINAQAMANETDVELESPFINFKQKGFKVFAEEEDTVDHIVCYKLKLVRNNSDTSTWFFNTADYSLVKKQAIAKNEQLNKSLLNIYYSDYRVVKGLKIPFKIVSKADDQTILTIIISNLQLNVPISDEAFKP